MRDYIRIANTYAREAADENNSAKFGKWIRLAARRYISDLDRAKNKSCPFTFDASEAVNACDFIEKLPHVEGEWDSPTITLHPAHVFFVVQLFGFRQRAGGARRFSSALLGVARKNAKSTLAAAIMLYAFCCENNVGPQMISAATTGDQARIIFNIAKRMVQKEPDLREQFTLEAFANSIARYEVGGSFKPINAKASTQDGLNPSHVALDEIHAHKSHDLLNVLRSASGARKNVLYLYTTTEGYETPGPWPELRHFAKQVLDNVVEADHFLALYFAVDDDDDDFAELAWRKANPLMDVNPLLLAEIRKEALEAKQMPGRHAEFRIKRLNRQSASANGWIDLTKWRQCAGPVNLAELRDIPCYAGLDLASTRDMTAFRLVWRVNGQIYTYGRRWVPEMAVQQRTERGTVPYAAWVGAGLIEQTEGDVTDYAVIEAAIKQMAEEYQIKEIAFDRWNATDLCNRLMAAELPMVEFIQGPKSYHPAMQALEKAYCGGVLHHNGDPVLQWCASNIVARMDANLNMAPDKKRSADKIDDMTALIMAMGRMVLAEEEPESYYEALARQRKAAA